MCRGGGTLWLNLPVFDVFDLMRSRTWTGGRWACGCLIYILFIGIRHAVAGAFARMRVCYVFGLLTLVQVGLRLPHGAPDAALAALEPDACHGQGVPPPGYLHAGEVQRVWLFTGVPVNLPAEHKQQLARGARLVYQTRRIARSEGLDASVSEKVEGGRERAATAAPGLVGIGSYRMSSACGLVLHIGNESECWGLSDGGLCVIWASVETETGSGTESEGGRDLGADGQGGRRVAEAEAVEAGPQPVRYSLFIRDLGWT